MMVVLHYHIQFLGVVVVAPPIVPPIRCPCKLRELRVSVVNCRSDQAGESPQFWLPTCTGDGY